MPNPERDTVATWLADLNPDYIHSEGWPEINRRFHGLVMAVRSYLNRHYPNPDERRAAYDGFTLGILAMTHFDDARTLEELLNSPPADEPSSAAPVAD